ncbi:MAG: phage terminase large subunit [Bacteroidales bacterium]
MQQEINEKDELKRDVFELVKHYRKFFKFAWSIISHEELIYNWHIDYIARELQILASYVIAREKTPYDLIINLPPGMSKSSLVTQAFPVWCWLHDPTICVIISSYSGGLSSDHSMKAKSIVQSDEFDLFNQYIEYRHGKALAIDKDTEGYWMNNYGGWYYATSTGGTVTGKHAHIIIRDDPLNPMQADSESLRQKANNFNDRTLSSRKKDKTGTPTITVMQRLHEDDPTGHDLLKKDKNIKHILLPGKITNASQVKPIELADRYINGLLDPIRLSEEVIQKEMIELGQFGYAGQYDQQPYPEGGGKIKGAWFNYCHEKELPRGMIWDLWIDGAYTKSTANDATGKMVCAYHAGENMLYIRHANSGHYEMPELLKDVAEYGRLNGMDMRSRTYIEPKASGLTLKQLLRNEKHMNAVDIDSHLVSEGKEARVQTASPKIEAGRVTLVTGSWTAEFIQQLEGYPNAKADEYCDLIGYAVDKYFAVRKKAGIIKRN